LEYDGDGVAAGISVHRAFPVVPSGSFYPELGVVNLAGVTIVCGDGREGGDGSSPGDYHAILGVPDYAREETFELPFADVKAHFEFYQFLGMEFTWVEEVDKGFLGVEHPNEVLSVILFPPFAGRTPEGLGIGDARQTIEGGLDLTYMKEEDLADGHRVFVYETSSGKLLGVIYENGGASPDDRALAFAVNLPDL